MAVVGQLEFQCSQGQGKKSGGWWCLGEVQRNNGGQETLEGVLESSAYCRGGRSTEERDAEYLQKVTRVFSSGGGGRWGGWKSRWWRRESRASSKSETAASHNTSSDVLASFSFSFMLNK